MPQQPAHPDGAAASSCLGSLSTSAAKPTHRAPPQRFSSSANSASLTTCRSLANVLPAAVGATLVGAVAYFALAPSQPAANLARADSNAGAQKKKMLVRRHSSGDHAFLPNRQETAAKNLAARGGVQPGSMHDSEGLSLPSTHERHSDGRPRT
eukprot:CAMPEP_0118809918 /NCGR_PEP_ID=MMETSP1162-20130426/631_1 /TAXON_ID=33656 /ORGANISM="Phaeocystis Sp, Strain CCMP2710" /LENGTH=152 /DNA_ID=CAMNT_0006739391 /DNA_START=90 /DNA_END=548 /DNA_ORIENTATION=+